MTPLNWAFLSETRDDAQCSIRFTQNSFPFYRELNNPMCPLDMLVNGIIAIAIPPAMCCWESSIGRDLSNLNRPIFEVL